MNAKRGKPFAHAAKNQSNNIGDIFYRKKSESQPGFMDKIIDDARLSGSLNLSNRSLTEVPGRVWSINVDSPQRKAEVDFSQSNNGWWEQTPLTKLIMAFNNLSVVPSDVKRLDTLTVLDLQNNEITEISNDIGSLISLRSMNLSNNRLSRLPPTMSKLTNLTSLYLKNNQLKEMDIITGLVELENLDLSENQIREIPPSISQIRNLRKFMLGINSIQEVPESLGTMIKLFHLELSANSIEKFPNVFASNCNVEVLDLRQNRLKTFPNLQNIPIIKELHLGHNMIEELRDSDLVNLTSLIILDIGYNKIKELPKDINQLSSLTRLDLSCNDLTSLPCELGFMENLKFMSLDGNLIRGLMRDIPKGTEAVKKILRTRSQSDDMDGGDSSLVQKAGQNTGIIGHSGGMVDAFLVGQSGCLNLREKKLESVPDEVWIAVQDKPVKEVFLEKNKLTSIPEGLYLFGQSLVTLNLSSNMLKSVPNDICLLLRLKNLDLSQNKLDDLPDELGSLRSLDTLNISNNQGLGRLPFCLYNLRSLSSLLVSGCRIKEIHAYKLKEMENLTTLDLSNNDINTVPPELGLCTQIQILKLEGNCFRVPRAAIVDKGTGAILEYLRGRIPQ